MEVYHDEIMVTPDELAETMTHLVPDENPLLREYFDLIDQLAVEALAWKCLARRLREDRINYAIASHTPLTRSEARATKCDVCTFRKPTGRR